MGDPRALMERLTAAQNAHDHEGMLARFHEDCRSEQPQFVGRAVELSALEAVAACGGALVVRGDPGIGKTTLLDALRADGVILLRARGVETEAELAFSALADLLAPLLSLLPALPAPQSAALSASLALGPPAPGDRLAICVATLGLLRAAGPVLAVVDDFHWVDAASRECILYAARRAGGDVAFVLAVRDPSQPLGLAEVPVGPLEPDAALELLARTAPDLAPDVAAALAEAAAGNPLALVELPSTLTPSQRAGVSALESPLPPGRRLHEAFAGRIEELDMHARHALVVAATYAGDDLVTLAAAGVDVERLAAAEERGLVRIDAGRVTFAHPIIRGAAYQSVGPGERRDVHRALAGALGGEQRAWHLAAAAVGPDEEAAAALEEVARAAAGRRAFAAASAAFERAARLSAHGAQRLLDAGRAAGAAGAPERAMALLAEAAEDDALRTEAEQLRGRLMIWSGAPVEATDLLVAEGERAAARDPALAATLLADAANACTAINSYLRAEALARRAAELSGDSAPVIATLGWVLVLRGDAVEGRARLEEAARLVGDLDPLGPDWPWHHLLLRASIPLGDFERGLRDGLAIAARAREAGALATLGGALVVAADAAFRLGDWLTAADATVEAIRVAGDTGQHSWHGYALATRARLLAARGRFDDAHAAVATAREIAESKRISSGLRFVDGALGFVELSAGRPAEAIETLERNARLVAGSGLAEPTLVPWEPDLIEAYAGVGRLDDARRVLATLEHQAAEPFARAAVARCRGLLNDDFAALPMGLPFERARTQLAYGRRLHRARRRADARERLREALSGFERLGAAAWAEQARAELRAAGGRRRAAHTDHALTPQELRVAEAVKRGAFNREIAAELYLSPKTIEFHLRHIYRKVGVRSRTELVAALAREDQGASD